MEFVIARNFCFWRNIVLKCGCTSMITMVIETTVAFNELRVPDATILEVALEMGYNLSYTLANMLA